MKGKEVIKLKSQGKTYKEISKITGLSKSTISYHCGEGQKKKTLQRQKQRRRENKSKLIEYKGGKCEKCGYNKCDAALEFHHLDPNKKDFGIASFKSLSLEKLKKEVDKCVLVCSNCHKEIHDKGI